MCFFYIFIYKSDTSKQTVRRFIRYRSCAIISRRDQHCKHTSAVFIQQHFNFYWHIAYLWDSSAAKEEKNVTQTFSHQGDKHQVDRTSQEHINKYWDSTCHGWSTVNQTNTFKGRRLKGRNSAWDLSIKLTRQLKKGGQHLGPTYSGWVKVVWTLKVV